MKKLAIITTHPIQYNAPLFKMLANRGTIVIKVFYTWGEQVLQNKYDPGFGKVIEWDIPLLEGYEYSFVKNVSTDPGSHHFRGIQNPMLISEIEKWNPDAILVFGWSFKSHLKTMRHFHGRLPVFFRGDSTLLDEVKNSFFKRIIKTAFLKWVYAYVDKVLYVGKLNKNYFLKFGLKENQLIFAPHAIANERFSRKYPGDWREKKNIPQDATVFLFAGKFEDKKDPLLLINSFNEINAPNAYLLMVGNGELENELKYKRESLPPEKKNRILIIEFQNQSIMPEIYQSADVFILPSKGPGETWGLAVNEAMASGCTILVSDQCGCYEDLVENGSSGYVFSSGSKNELIERMNFFLINRNSLTLMKSAAQQKIKQFSLEKVCYAIEKAISKL